MVIVGHRALAHGIFRLYEQGILLSPWSCLCADAVHEALYQASLEFPCPGLPLFNRGMVHAIRDQASFICRSLHELARRSHDKTGCCLQH